MKLTHNELNIEPKPTPKHVDLHDITTMNRVISAVESGSTYDSYDDCERHKSKDTGQG